eukprot:CCRYP_016324-RA/>CCRYP_016324-RA protein AED:0.42 eAED:0.42 QI:194/1/1/1/1/1/2/226/353
MASSLPPYALEVTPESSLQFSITQYPPSSGGDGDESNASKCMLTLRHTGATKECLAFKVKTTQPRRYLVRPNQGIVYPNSSETISILLVDKDRQVLWSTYERLGQSALDHSKDKFLVQSCVVSEEFAEQFQGDERGEGGQYRKELVEALTAMWNSVASGGTDVAVYNKKLHVKHLVDVSTGDAGNNEASAAGAGAGLGGTLPPSFSQPNQQSADKMSPEQLFDEVASLRRKYDELVAFSVNLTAERDILNNTLEQTRRDLNREIASRQALEKQGFKGGPVKGGVGGQNKSKGGGGISMNTMIIVVILSFLAAIRATNNGSVGFLRSVPALGGFLGFNRLDHPSRVDSALKDEL